MAFFPQPLSKMSFNYLSFFTTPKGMIFFLISSMLDDNKTHPTNKATYLLTQNNKQSNIPTDTKQQTKLTRTPPVAPQHTYMLTQ
jgi:hypothetical protein